MSKINCEKHGPWWGVEECPVCKSERGAVRSDGLLCRPDAACETPQDRPRCAEPVLVELRERLEDLQEWSSNKKLSWLQRRRAGRFYEGLSSAFGAAVEILDEQAAKHAAASEASGRHNGSG